MQNILYKRIALSMLAGLVLGLTLSELTFVFLGLTGRQPKTITVVIPNGTAEIVSRGEKSIGLPENMTFVVGDTLIIKNEDVVDHQLGPLWVPPGTSGQLVLGQPESLAYECSFQPGNYFGLDVNEAITLGTRIYGILFAGIPMGILIALYASIIPAKPASKQ
jgi:hypothetical protein